MNGRNTLIEYLKLKVDECDWHAVSDAANDLRVLEARCENVALDLDLTSALSGEGFRRISE